VLGTILKALKTFVLVDQNDLKFLIPADKDNYIHFDIKLYVLGKFVSGSGNNVEVSEHTAVTNNFLQSFFSQCNVVLNGTTNMQASEHYNYGFYLEILLTYGTDTVAKHLTNGYWYRDTGDVLQCNPTTATVTATTNREFITR